ncbi:MAG: hypothetical protein EON85_16135, partial [Brevundimonas sp.]
MKLTTLNLQGFEHWNDRQEQIVRYLHNEQPDVVLFQEVVYLPEISPYTQVQLLNQSLHYPYHQSDVSRLQRGIDYPVYREGLAAISKHPIVTAETVVLQQDPTDEHNRIVTLLDLFINDQVVKLANVHFSLTDDVDFATAHLAETLAIITARGERRIIAGDFNMSDLDTTKSLWSDSYTASTATEYVTFPSMDNKRIDYVLLPKEFEFDSIKTSGDGLSDHRALTTS